VLQVVDAWIAACGKQERPQVSSVPQHQTNSAPGVWLIVPAAVRRAADGSRLGSPRARVSRASARQARPRRSPKARFRIVRSTFLQAAARQLPTPGRRPGFP
jgi:hypothetical protein